MKIELSFLSKHRSMIGFDVQRSGIMEKDENNVAIFQSAIEVTIGIIFVYLTIQIGFGKSMPIEDMITRYTDIMKSKDIE